MDQGVPIIWPKRCPTCGSVEDLISVEFTAMRRKSSYFVIYLRVVTESYKLSFLSCRRHAYKNEIGISILRQTAMMALTRLLIYVLCFSSLRAVYLVISGQLPLSSYTANPAVFIIMGIGVFGTLLILWAKKVTSILPLHLDADMDVAVIQMSDKIYARDFRRANPKATHRLLTREPPFFLRPDFWKAIIVLGAILYFSRLSS